MSHVQLLTQPPSLRVRWSPTDVQRGKLDEFYSDVDAFPDKKQREILASQLNINVRQVWPAEAGGGVEKKRPREHFESRDALPS